MSQKKMIQQTKTPMKNLKKISALEQKIAGLWLHADKGQRAKLKQLLVKLREQKPKSFTQHLSEQPYKLWRDLTVQEQRADFKQLNDEFNVLQVDLEDELSDITAQETELFLNKVKNKVSAGDIMAIGGLALMFRGKVRKVVDNTISQSYEFGKKTAAKEMSVGTPTTPLKATRLKSLEASQIAETFAFELENTAKSLVRSAIAADASDAAIVTAARAAIQDDASKMISNISGSVVGQYVNRGRRQVFLDNIGKITKFQRSEVLDSNTCNICLSLDSRIVPADSPMAEMDLVHSHCRGLWVPIFVVDDQPEDNPIPKTVQDAFDVIDGRPVMNGFRQVKNPIQRADNKEAQAIIKRKLK